LVQPWLAHLFVVTVTHSCCRTRASCFHHLHRSRIRTSCCHRPRRTRASWCSLGGHTSFSPRPPSPPLHTAGRIRASCCHRPRRTRQPWWKSRTVPRRRGAVSAVWGGEGVGPESEECVVVPRVRSADDHGAKKLSPGPVPGLFVKLRRHRLRW